MIKRLYDIIGSSKENPWFVLYTIMATDEHDATTQAIEMFGYTGFRTVQTAPPAFRPRNTKPYR